jgi:hypothetical protein
MRDKDQFKHYTLQEVLDELDVIDVLSNLVIAEESLR